MNRDASQERTRRPNHKLSLLVAESKKNQAPQNRKPERRARGRGGEALGGGCE